MDDYAVIGWRWVYGCGTAGLIYHTEPPTFDPTPHVEWSEKARTVQLIYVKRETNNAD